MSVTKVHL